MFSQSVCLLNGFRIKDIHTTNNIWIRYSFEIGVIYENEKKVSDYVIKRFTPLRTPTRTRDVPEIPTPPEWLYMCRDLFVCGLTLIYFCQPTFKK